MADIQVERGTSVTVTETFSVDGSPINLDSGVPTVVATAPDGTTTTPTASGSWTGRTTGQYRIVLAAQPEVTWRDLTWTGTIGGQPQTLESRVEWIGSLLFTIADLRGWQPIGGGGTPFDDPVKYPDAKIHQVRAEVLGEFCRRLNFSPVRRYTHEVHSVDRGGPVILKELYPGDLLDLSVAGVAQSVGDYAIGRGGVLLPVSNYAAGPWTAYGQGVVGVGYSHGWDSFADDRGREAALMRAAMKLNPSVSSTMNSYSSPDGGQYNWDRAGTRNAAGEKVYFGVGAIAEWINEHRQDSVAVA